MIQNYNLVLHKNCTVLFSSKKKRAVSVDNVENAYKLLLKHNYASNGLNVCFRCIYFTLIQGERGPTGESGTPGPPVSSY